jgi:predicted  nucleic acid-binding Zn-ribbon protein
MSNSPRKPRTSAASSADKTTTAADAQSQPPRLRDVPAPQEQGKQDPATQTAQLHADIDRTREQLSDTVEALAHKVDVPTQVKAKAQQVTETVQGKTEELTHQLTDKVTKGADAVQAKADEAAAQAKGLIDQAVAALPPTVRDRVERAIAVARQRPVPTAIVPVLVVLVLRRVLRRRSRAGS